MAPDTAVIGVLPGEGVGPEVVGAALRVLAAVEGTNGKTFEIREGGAIGLDAEARFGRPLSDEVVRFCKDVFSAGGAVLAGPGGGRFVYDLRTRFDLFCKLSPLRVRDELVGAASLRPEHIRGVDVLVVRENASGIYHGSWGIRSTNGRREAKHAYRARDSEVRRLLQVAADCAARRRGELAVVVKTAGIPAVSSVWRETAAEVAAERGLRHTILEVDHAAYCLIQHPRTLDVVVAPDLFGDVLADLGGALVGSRGITYSGNFSFAGAAVYQTNHGAAYDLARSDRANPAGQILSLAMLLRESFGRDREADLIEDALAAVWRAGWRTFDLAEPDCRVVGTREFAELVAEQVDAIARR